MYTIVYTSQVFLWFLIDKATFPSNFLVSASEIYFPKLLAKKLSDFGKCFGKVLSASLKKTFENYLPKRLSEKTFHVWHGLKGWKIYWKLHYILRLSCFLSMHRRFVEHNKLYLRKQVYWLQAIGVAW